MLFTLDISLQLRYYQLVRLKTSLFLKNYKHFEEHVTNQDLDGMRRFKWPLDGNLQDQDDSHQLGFHSMKRDKGI